MSGMCWLLLVLFGGVREVGSGVGQVSAALENLGVCSKEGSVLKVFQFHFLLCVLWGVIIRAVWGLVELTRTCFSSMSSSSRLSPGVGGPKGMLFP